MMPKHCMLPTSITTGFRNGYITHHLASLSPVSEAAEVVWRNFGIPLQWLLTPLDVCTLLTDSIIESSVGDLTQLLVCVLRPARVSLDDRRTSWTGRYLWRSIQMARCMLATRLIIEYKNSRFLTTLVSASSLHDDVHTSQHDCRSGGDYNAHDFEDFIGHLTAVNDR